MYQHDSNYVNFFYLYKRKPYRKSLNILRNPNFLKLQKLCTYPSHNIFAKIYDLEMKDMMKIVFTPGADFLLGKVWFIIPSIVISFSVRCNTILLGTDE